MENNPIKVGDRPGRRLAILLSLAVVLVAVVWWSQRPPASSESDLADAARPEVNVDGSRVQQVLPPTPSAAQAADAFGSRQATPTGTAGSERSLITETISTIPLPTVTPSPTPGLLAPIVLEIDGRATISMTLRGAIVESSGRPLRMTVARRAYRFDETRIRHLDRWCIPMGVVHTVVEVDMIVDPATEEVMTSGTVSLYTDYCESPGELADQSSFEFEVGLGQTVPLVQYLESKRELLAVPRLLDTEAEAAITLNFASARPAQ